MNDQVKNTAGAENAENPDAQPDAQKRLTDAFSELLQLIATIDKEQYEAVASAHNDFLRGWHESAAVPDAAKRIETAYGEYVQRLVDRCGPEARDSDVRRAEAGYRSYVKAVADVLGGGADTGVPPAVLAGLGQHLLAVASWATTAGIAR